MLSLIHIFLEIRGGKAIFRLDGLSEGGTLCAGLDGDVLAAQVLVAFDFFIAGLDPHDDAGIKIRLGKIKCVLTFRRDAHTGDHGVGLACLERLNGRVEAEHLNFIGKALIFGDGFEQIHVDADKFTAFILELEGSEGCVGRDQIGLACIRTSCLLYTSRCV